AREPRRAARGPAGHGASGRAPGLDARSGRPRPLHGRRPDRRVRHPRGAARRLGGLCNPRPRLRGRPDVTGLAPDTMSPEAPDSLPKPIERSPEEEHILRAGALGVLRRGLAVTPELRRGVAFTVGLALAMAGGKLAVPILIQQILDRGVLGDDGFRPTFVFGACAATAALISVLYVLGRATYLRLVRASENSLLGLRVRAFEHIHRLSMAEHGEHRRGALVARVTSDIETLAQFMEWGGVAWIVNGFAIATTLGVMTFYDWRLALLVVVAFVPMVLLLPMLQRRQLAAEDRVRTSVGEALAEVSETITGAPLVHAYGLEERNRRRLRGAIDRVFRAHMLAGRYFALMFPLGDVFGSVAMAGVVAAGVTWGPGWGLEV